MKLILVVAALLIAVVNVALSLPTNEFEELADLELWDADEGVRQRRVTCDLMSYGGKVGHSACAANCLSMGKAGGRCNDGVCQCRKTTFKDLWDKRFG